jgi:hypothetical protein
MRSQKDFPYVVGVTCWMLPSSGQVCVSLWPDNIRINRLSRIRDGKAAFWRGSVCGTSFRFPRMVYMLLS